MAGTYIRVAGKTDIGRVRTRNEDTFVIADLDDGERVKDGESPRIAVGKRGVLLAVSDGMGGAYAGHVASALVIDTITREMSDRPSSAPGTEAIVGAVQIAHEKVLSAGEEKGRSMGATLTAVCVHEKEALVAEVGDSRAYLVRAGRISRLTHDQSLVQQLVDAGVVTPDEAEHSMFRNVILQAMGQQKEVQVALGRLELRARDCFILCSDGLTHHVPDAEIREIVLSSGDLRRACARLIDIANERGGTDNVTVVMGGVGGELPIASSATDDVEKTYEMLMDWVGG